jgi:hypothetical protein
VIFKDLQKLVQSHSGPQKFHLLHRLGFKKAVITVYIAGRK